MTEKDKMITQQEYLGWDTQLCQDRERAKDLCFTFNNTTPSHRDERHAIIRQLFDSVGDNPWIETSFQCDYGYNISVGNNFYANHNCVILDGAKVTIKDNVLFGPNVGLYTPGHPFDIVKRNQGYETAHPITIHNNVWLGADVSIIGGVTIGENSIIGAGSVVTKDIPANVVAAGNPCKVIKTLDEK